MQLYDHMAIFAAIAEAGSFTGAAKTLALPKSTVSLRLRELEEQLGTVLMHRTTRKLILTAEGEQFLDACRRMVTIADEARQKLSETRQEPQGELVIGCPYAMSDTILPQVISTYLQRHPKMRVRVIASNDRQDLMTEGIDVAFRFGALADSSALIARTVFQLPRLLVASPAYLAANSKLNQPSDLLAHQSITSSHSGTWHFRDHGSLKPAVRIEVNDLLLARSLSLTGAGISMLPAMLVQDALDKGMLVSVLPDHPLQEGPLSLVYLRHKVENTALRLFVDLFADMAAGQVRAEVGKIQ